MTGCYIIKSPRGATFLQMLYPQPPSGFRVGHSAGIPGGSLFFCYRVAAAGSVKGRGGTPSASISSATASLCSRANSPSSAR